MQQCGDSNSALPAAIGPGGQGQGDGGWQSCEQNGWGWQSGGGGCWQPGGKPSAGAGDNLFIKGLPLGMTEDALRQIFAQYCTVVSCKVLPATEGRSDCCGFVRAETPAQAQWMIENLDAKIPQGLTSPLSVKMAQGGGAAGGGGQDLSDWICAGCTNSNFARRDSCNRCGASRPAGGAADGGWGGDCGGWDCGGWNGGGWSSSSMGKKGKGDKGYKCGKFAKGKGKVDTSVSLYLKGLPPDSTEESVREVFGQYAVLYNVKVLPMVAGKPSAAAFIKVCQEDAEWFIANLYGSIPQGYTNPITLTYSDDGKGKGKDGKSKGMEMVPDDVEESENVFIRGLPIDITEEYLTQVLGQYGGTIQSVKLMIPKGVEGGPPVTKCSALVKMGSIDEAKHLIQLVDNQTPNGLSMRLYVKFEGEGISHVSKFAKRMQMGAGEFYYGTVRSYNVEKKCGFIACDKLMQEFGIEVYVHETVLQSGKAGVGDLVLFFVMWKGELPQAQKPLVRVAAECPLDGPAFHSNRGWFKGVVDLDKGYGFIQSAEMQALFGKDVYVHKDIAGDVKPGWVCFNVRIVPEKGSTTGSLVPMATNMINCTEDWKPFAGDLTVSRELPGACFSKGKDAKGCWKGGIGWGAPWGGKGGDGWGVMPMTEGDGGWDARGADWSGDSSWSGSLTPGWCGGSTCSGSKAAPGGAIVAGCQQGKGMVVGALKRPLVVPPLVAPAGPKVVPPLIYVGPGVWGGDAAALEGGPPKFQRLDEWSTGPQAGCCGEDAALAAAAFAPGNTTFGQDAAYSV